MRRIDRSRTSEFLRFAIVGAVNTATTYAVYLLMAGRLGVHGAYALAYALGIAVAYVLNSRFVFNTPLNPRTALFYPLVYVAQYLLGAALLFAFVTWTPLDAKWAALVAIACSVPASYLLNRFALARGRPH